MTQIPAHIKWALRQQKVEAFANRIIVFGDTDKDSDLLYEALEKAREIIRKGDIK